MYTVAIVNSFAAIHFLVHLLDFVGNKMVRSSIIHASAIASPVINPVLDLGPGMLCRRRVIEGFGDTKLGIVPK